MYVIRVLKRERRYTCIYCMALLYNVTRSKSHTPRNVPALTPLHSERQASMVSDQRTPKR